MEQRLEISSFAFEEDALQWLQWMEANNQITTWTTFLDLLRARFGPSEYEDVQGSLAKLMQVTSVQHY